MEEQLMTFETSKLAKEKGFNEYGKLCYSEDGESISPNSSFYSSQKYPIEACTQSLLQKWLREKHKIHAFAHPIDDLKDWAAIIDGDTPSAFTRLYQDEGGSSTYEEALEIALQEALSQIKPIKTI